MTAKGRKPVPDIGDIVKVEWVDSVCGFGWQSIPDDTVSMSATSVGVLVNITLDRYIISTSIGPRGDCLSPLHIPRSAVQSITVVNA